mgnify:CR=1 FL=1
MNLKNYQITVGEVLQNPQAKAMLQKELPMVMRLPMANAIPLKDVIHYAGGYVSQRKMQNILDQLSRL